MKGIKIYFMADEQIERSLFFLVSISLFSLSLARNSIWYEAGD